MVSGHVGEYHKDQEDWLLYVTGYYMWSDLNISSKQTRLKESNDCLCSCRRLECPLTKF